ncbi:MAG: hypothetical protein QS98_C0001G0002 [archaeon GW2011_AR3]|nr:MAG: hypothetical protein QS98_C0001G0002 [archaeon GW2011_AR3]MBS3109280.1 hypothetical protein [Candidatus Woesearchaeota archaeon]
MALFGLSKKKEEASMPPPPFSDSATNLPPDQLGAFQQPGTPDDLMGQPQQQGGYPASQPYQSYNTMGQADMQQGGNPMDYGQYPDPQDMGSQGQPMDQPYYGQHPGSYQQNYPAGSPDEKIEEIAEAIIEEKWNELVKNVNKIIEWKDKTESRITQLEQRMNDIRADFETLHKGILGKVGEYDQNLTNLGAEIKAMEKVFSKILPTFTENVNELSRLAKDLKMKSSSK